MKSAIERVQSVARHDDRPAFWSFMTVMPDDQADDLPLPRTLYGSAQGAVNAFMRQYGLKAPLDWTLEDQLSICATWNDLQVKVFALFVAFPEEPK